MQIRMKLSGLRPDGGRAARLRLYATDIARTLFERDVDAPEDRPVTLEVRDPPAGRDAPDPDRQRRARAEPRGAGLAPPELPAVLPPGRPGSPGRSSSPTTTGRPIWPTILLDLDRVGRPVAGILAPARPIAASSSRAEEATLRRTSTYARGDPLPVRRSGLPPASSTGGGIGPVGEAVRGVSAEARRRLRGGGEDRPFWRSCARTSFLYMVEGSAEAPVDHRLDRSWELASPAVVFPVEHHARRAIARPGGLGERFHRAGDPAGGSPADDWPTRGSRAFAGSFPRQWLQLRRVGMFEPDRKIYP